MLNPRAYRSEEQLGVVLSIKILDKVNALTKMKLQSHEGNKLLLSVKKGRSHNHVLETK